MLPVNDGVMKKHLTQEDPEGHGRPEWPAYGSALLGYDTARGEQPRIPGREVWRWRDQHLTYAEISERTGLSEATLSRILRGHRAGSTSPRLLCAINGLSPVSCCTSTQEAWSHCAPQSPRNFRTVRSGPRHWLGMPARLHRRSLPLQPRRPAA
jgi:hypothetical protein